MKQLVQRALSDLLLACGAGLAILLSGCDRGPAADADEVASRPSTRIEGAPMCPWREPDEDRAAFFPGADRHDTEVVILSGLRPELSQRLGRAPTAAENALHLHRIFQGERLAGQVAVRRVKGESGAIELVLATGTDGVVRGVRIQRQREPEATMQALDAAWLDGFRGKSVRDVLAAGRDLPEVPGRARASAAAIADGVRSELILLDVAASPRALRRPAPEANPRSHH